MTILLIEDEKALLDALSYVLKKQSHTVDCCSDGETGYEYAVTGRYDVVVLDVMLPKMSGFEVLEKLRSEKCSTPVLLLTALTDVADRVRGLDAGADDYLGKPFDMEEFLARLRALYRRKTETINENVLHFSDVELNLTSLELIHGDRRIKVTVKESQILQYFFKRATHVVTKDELILRCWGYDSEAEYNHVEVYMSFIRKKLQFINAKMRISTVRGAGYRIEEAYPNDRQ